MQLARDVIRFTRKHWRDAVETVVVIVCAAGYWGATAAAMFYGTRLFFAAMVYLGEQAWQ
jgi:fatty acid desaturase